MDPLEMMKMALMGQASDTLTAASEQEMAFRAQVAQRKRMKQYGPLEIGDAVATPLPQLDVGPMSVSPAGHGPALQGALAGMSEADGFDQLRSEDISGGRHGIDDGRIGDRLGHWNALQPSDYAGLTPRQMAGGVAEGQALLQLRGEFDDSRLANRETKAKYMQDLQGTSADGRQVLAPEEAWGWLGGNEPQDPAYRQLPHYPDPLPLIDIDESTLDRFNLRRY